MYTLGVFHYFFQCIFNVNIGRQCIHYPTSNVEKWGVEKKSCSGKHYILCQLPHCTYPMYTLQKNLMIALRIFFMFYKYVQCYHYKIIDILYEQKNKTFFEMLPRIDFLTIPYIAFSEQIKTHVYIAECNEISQCAHRLSELKIFKWNSCSH